MSLLALPLEALSQECHFSADLFFLLSYFHSLNLSDCPTCRTAFGAKRDSLGWGQCLLLPDALTGTAISCNKGKTNLSTCLSMLLTVSLWLCSCSYINPESCSVLLCTCAQESHVSWYRQKGKIRWCNTGQNKWFPHMLQFTSSSVLDSNRYTFINHNVKTDDSKLLWFSKLFLSSWWVQLTTSTLNFSIQGEKLTSRSQHSSQLFCCCETFSCERCHGWH